MRQLRKYHISGVDLDGWWRFSLEREDGVQTHKTRKEVAKLRHAGRIIDDPQEWKQIQKEVQ